MAWNLRILNLLGMERKSVWRLQILAFCDPCAPQPELPSVEVLLESLLGCDFCGLPDILLAPCNRTVCSDGNDLESVLFSMAVGQPPLSCTPADIACAVGHRGSRGRPLRYSWIPGGANPADSEREPLIENTRGPASSC